MDSTAMTVFAIYYAFGIAWFATGLGKNGWLLFTGHPIAALLWVTLNAAVWPLILFKIVRDVLRGKMTTDLME
jgi:hypothetical protein